MHQQVIFEIKRSIIKGEIRCDFGNCIHFQYFDSSRQIIPSGYKSHFLGLDEYPEKRIVEKGVEQILEMFELLYNLKPILKEAGKIVSQPTDLSRFAKWRKFLQNPAKYDKQSLWVDNSVEPVQLTLF